jgi:hypothetical protein
MKPRLPASVKWTPLPKELLQQIRTVFADSFKAHVGTGRIDADGRIYPGEILVKVGFKPSSGLRQSHWEISMEYKANKDNVLKLLHLAVDAAASLLEQTFAAEDDGEFPRLWDEIEFEGRKIYVQYTTENSELEAEANRLLGLKDGDELVHAEDLDLLDEESPESIKARLGLTDDEEQADFPDEDEDEDAPPPAKKRH